ncbi:hypothetical protein OAX96_03115 [Prochlorococcus sp. AH-736-K15]|nr:hypothetical protein [Prochlorococcus sp. AH-736-K15]
MFISRTPYRLSFYGGSLDYKEWYENNPVKIICAGLDYYCYQNLRVLPSFFDFNYRLSYSIIENVKNVNDIQHPTARELIRKYGGEKSLEISYTGDLPSKSGIGSSSAFTVGLINCLNALNNRYIGRTQLAMEAINLEKEIVKETVGIQDQCASAFGGLVIIEADKQNIRPRRLLVNPDYITYLENNLIMGFDGISRSSQLSAKNTVDSIKDSEKSDLTKELSFLTEKGINLFCKQMNIERHATITKQIRDIKIRLNGDENNQRLNKIVHNTEKAGSLCTRFLGAGGGGFFVCWAPKYIHNDIKNSVNIKTWVRVKFSEQGSQLIFVDS